MNTAMAGKVTEQEHAISIEESTEVGEISTRDFQRLNTAVSTNL